MNYRHVCSTTDLIFFYNVATQAYPGWPLSRGRVAVLDCVPAPAGPVQNGVSGAAAVRFLRVGPALSIGAFCSPVAGTPVGERLARPFGQL
jgi:hypothetical protein